MDRVDKQRVNMNLREFCNIDFDSYGIPKVVLEILKFLTQQEMPVIMDLLGSAIYSPRTYSKFKTRNLQVIDEDDLNK